MDIYVNMPRKVHFKNKSIICIEDIAGLEGPSSAKGKIGKLPILQKGNKNHEVVDFNDIVKAVNREFPDIALISTGEQSSLVEFADTKAENIALTFLKIAFVCIVLFTGASTAIMSFHSDAQIYKVFEKYTELFLGEGGNVKIIEAAYSAGLAAGIIVFFNHFAGRKLTDDPTPIQVEMYKYEKDVTETIVDNISRKEEGL